MRNYYVVALNTGLRSKEHRREMVVAVRSVGARIEEGEGERAITAVMSAREAKNLQQNYNSLLSVSPVTELELM